MPPSASDGTASVPVPETWTEHRDGSGAGGAEHSLQPPWERAKQGCLGLGCGVPSGSADCPILAPHARRTETPGAEGGGGKGASPLRALGSDTRAGRALRPQPRRRRHTAGAPRPPATRPPPPAPRRPHPAPGSATRPPAAAQPSPSPPRRARTADTGPHVGAVTPTRRPQPPTQPPRSARPCLPPAGTARPGSSAPRRLPAARPRRPLRRRPAPRPPARTATAPRTAARGPRPGERRWGSAFCPRAAGERPRARGRPWPARGHGGRGAGGGGTGLRAPPGPARPGPAASLPTSPRYLRPFRCPPDPPPRTAARPAHPSPPDGVSVSTATPVPNLGAL